MAATKPTTIDAYIATFPDHIQEMLEQVRATIKAAAPEATETIKYAIPTFLLKGNLVHFAAYKHHIGFYPAPFGVEDLEDELTAYKAGKGTLQFPLDQPMPLPLISKLVERRVKENLEKAEKK